MDMFSVIARVHPVTWVQLDFSRVLGKPLNKIITGCNKRLMAELECVFVESGLSSWTSGGQSSSFGRPTGRIVPFISIR